MKKANWIYAAVVVAVVGLMAALGCAPMQPGDWNVPQYKADASWPKPLKANWIWGQVSSVTVDNSRSSSDVLVKIFALD